MTLNRIIVRTLFALLAIFSVLLTSDAAWAQTTGAIRGIVWDEDELELELAARLRVPEVRQFR